MKTKINKFNPQLQKMIESSGMSPEEAAQIRNEIRAELRSLSKSSLKNVESMMNLQKKIFEKYGISEETVEEFLGYMGDWSFSSTSAGGSALQVLVNNMLYDKTYEGLSESAVKGLKVYLKKRGLTLEQFLNNMEMKKLLTLKTTFAQEYVRAMKKSGAQIYRRVRLETIKSQLKKLAQELDIPLNKREKFLKEQFTAFLKGKKVNDTLFNTKMKYPISSISSWSASKQVLPSQFGDMVLISKVDPDDVFDLWMIEKAIHGEEVIAQKEYIMLSSLTQDKGYVEISLKDICENLSEMYGSHWSDEELFGPESDLFESLVDMLVGEEIKGLFAGGV